jgi:endonuclease G
MNGSIDTNRLIYRKLFKIHHQKLISIQSRTTLHLKTIYFIKLLLPVFTIVAGIALASCSDTGIQVSRGVDHTTNARLSSNNEKDALAKVLSDLAPAQAVDLKSSAGTSADPDPFIKCRQFFASGQSPILHHQRHYRALCFDSFAILHSGHTKTPVFVAQKLNRSSVTDAKYQKRKDRFFADARLPRSERAELQDYKRSGYSRGHMAPAGDMPNATAMEQSFSLANMVPQSAQHNGGIWSKVEQDTRKFVRRAKGDVYVITGPVYSQSSRAIGKNRVLIPDHIFKLVYDEAGQRAWAHWHANHDDAVGGHPISYRELVQRTGIEFLPGIALKHGSATSKTTS